MQPATHGPPSDLPGNQAGLPGRAPRQGSGWGAQHPPQQEMQVCLLCGGALPLRIRIPHCCRTWAWGAGSRDHPPLHPGTGAGFLTPSRRPMASEFWIQSMCCLSPLRYSVLQKLFPPIPHMKDPITDNLQSPKLVRPGSCWGGGVREEEATAPPAAEEQEAGPVLVGGRMVGGWGRLPGDSHAELDKVPDPHAQDQPGPRGFHGGGGGVCSPT